MSQPWFVLTKRYGEDVGSPNSHQLAEAVAELYHENLPGMTKADYEEHGSGHLRFGSDDGSMFVVEIVRTGIVVLEEWADQDFEKRLCPARKMKGVSEKDALQLWVWLAEGAIDKVRSQAWQAAT